MQNLRKYIYLAGPSVNEDHNGLDIDSFDANKEKLMRILSGKEVQTKTAMVLSNSTFLKTDILEASQKRS